MRLSGNHPTARKRIQPPARPTRMTADEVYKVLERAILIGSLRPREHLVEADLCEKLGASRTLLREVFKRLGAAGLIRLTPNKGATVRDFTPQEIEEVYSVRMLLEKAAAPLIAKNVTRDDLRELKALSGAFIEACRRKDSVRMIEANLAFHQRLAAVCRNRTLEQFIEVSRLQTHQARYIAWAEEGNVAASIRDHQDMLSALSRGDAAAFEAVMMRHIEKGRQDYQEIFSGQAGWNRGL